MKGIFLIGILFMLSFCSCKKSSQPTPSTPVTYTIGQLFGGGKIFYIDGTGQHGLIVSLSDQSLTIQPYSPGAWYGNHVLTGATSSSDGSTNTTKIISAQGNTTSYAAKLCRDYRGGGFSDWFLPAKDQLYQLFVQMTVLGGGFSTVYWSSTEADIDSGWILKFTDGLFEWSPKHGGRYVRAIRAF